MVKAIVEISEESNRILNIVKAKENLTDKSNAINLIVKLYAQELLEPSLQPEFVNELLEAQKERAIEIKDWDKHFGLN
jgi:hypothetical protein